MSSPIEIKSAKDLQQDLSTRYKSSTAPADDNPEQTDADLEILQRQGYVIIPNVLAAEEIEAVGAAISPLVDRAGRNNFEGVKTQRVYNVLEKTRAIDALAIHPRITALLAKLFQPNYLLSQAQIVNILPGEAAQPLHFDDGFYPLKRPRPALGAAAIWAIDDFTSLNGATVVIPESHKLGDEIITDRSQTIPVKMPAGSVVFFLGTLWHGGGANESQHARLAVTCQYCEPWLRTQENFFLGLSEKTLTEIPEPLLTMLGYSIHPPFMGMVDGMHPRRVL